jgi:putative peptidoglycan binding protein/caspase domain-containing protein
MMAPAGPRPSRDNASYSNASHDTGVEGCGRVFTARAFRGSTLLMGAVAFTLMCAAAVQPAVAGARVAMILAAEDYQNFRRSEAGVRKAEELLDLLRARGFDAALVTNPANAAARAALRDFATKVTTADIALAFLFGHGLSSVGQTFFLPSNASIDRSTDLLSRGLSVTNIAQIVSRAQAGGVCFLMTTPNFVKPIDGIDVKPQFDGDTKNIAVAFSNSAKIPISRIEAAAGLAASDVVNLLQKQPNADLRQLIAACGSQQQGTIYGVAGSVNLALPEKSRPIEAESDRKPPASVSATPVENHSALETLERLLDPRQVRRIQTRLAEMGLYQGPIDAVIGILTRNAIKEYQKKTGVADTGFLTPEQLAALTKSP